MNYNGDELQSKEFSDGSGLELYDFNAEIYDAQMGCFMNPDPTSGFPAVKRKPIIIEWVNVHGSKYNN